MSSSTTFLSSLVFVCWVPACKGIASGWKSGVGC